MPTPSPPSTSRATATQLHNQRETSNNDWRPVIDSEVVESAHVQSQLSTRFHACFNLSGVNNIDVIMDGLRKTHTDLNARMNRRLAKISADAEQKIMLTINDTKEEQKRLLAYDRKLQLRHDELYQEWLQKYVVELNKWRSKQLADLQAELMIYQQNIVQTSKAKIDRINNNANVLKTQILDQEKNAALNRTTRLTGQIYDLSRDDADFLGSESMTEVNLKIQANVGRIAPGQSCKNDFNN